MINQDFISLFEKDILEELNRKLREMSTKEVRIFDEKKINKKSYCNVLTSLVRLLSTKEVCGCFHLEGFKLLFSTNKEPKKDVFRKEIGHLISEMIKNGFRMEDKLAIYQRCFRGVIQVKVMRYNTELSTVEAVRETVIEQEN